MTGLVRDQPGGEGQSGGRDKEDEPDKACQLASFTKSLVEETRKVEQAKPVSWSVLLRVW